MSKETYTEFLRGLQLGHFKPIEITSYGSRTRGGVSNSLPPRALWGNLVATLHVLDELREHLGKPITLLSIYRSPAYNAEISGARYSQHLVNKAIDFKVKGLSPLTVWNRLVKMRGAGCFKGGVGRYSGFIHLDTRGRNATW